MKKLIPLYLAFLILPLLASPGPIGWASVNAYDQNGTTGGAGGEVVTVNNMADLVLYCSKTEPYIIRVEGPILISPKGRHVVVKSNKTIVGVTTDAGLSQGGFSVGNGQKNIIFQNLTISDTFVPGDWDGKDQDWDGFQIKGTCHHIWIDHCTLLRQGDGAIDITNGASYITISNTLIGQNNKASLIGSSDSDTHTDKYKVTIHHSWFNATTQRHPRVRFGQVHLFNNYYYDTGGYGREMNYAISNGYGIGIGVGAQIYSENNSFEKVVNPSQLYDKPETPGYLIDKGSVFENSGTIITRPDGINWDPADHYQYTPDDAELVKEIVMANAGAGKDSFTDVESIVGLKGSFDMQIFPVPVRDHARVIFEIPVAGNISITIKDITGRVARQITQAHYNQGKHSVEFNRDELRAGIYLITLDTNNQTLTRKIIIN